MKWRPIDLDFFLHCHYACDPHPRKNAPAYQEAARALFMKGLIVADHSTGNNYATTERGQKWLEMILATPLPELRWIDPRGEKQ